MADRFHSSVSYFGIYPLFQLLSTHHWMWILFRAPPWPYKTLLLSVWVVGLSCAYSGPAAGLVLRIRNHGPRQKSWHNRVGRGLRGYFEGLPLRSGSLYNVGSRCDGGDQVWPVFAQELWQAGLKMRGIWVAGGPVSYADPGKGY